MSNQCDGCMRGLPVDRYGMHRGKSGFWTGDIQLCTRDRYPSKSKPAVVILTEGDECTIDWRPEEESK
jgi:hypothetical protein